MARNGRNGRRLRNLDYLPPKRLLQLAKDNRLAPSDLALMMQGDPLDKTDDDRTTRYIARRRAASCTIAATTTSRMIGTDPANRAGQGKPLTYTMNIPVPTTKNRKG